MHREVWIKLKNYLPKVRKGLNCCLRTVELIGMFHKWLLQQQQKKVIIKCTHHYMLLKTLHCAHIPLNVVPKGTQPLAQPESLGEAETVWQKTRGSGGK